MKAMTSAVAVFLMAMGALTQAQASDFAVAVAKDNVVSLICQALMRQLRHRELRGQATLELHKVLVGLTEQGELLQTLFHPAREQVFFQMVLTAHKAPTQEELH